MELIIKWLINGISIFIAANVLPGVQVRDLSSALIVSVVLAIINTFIKPILLILTLPINLITFGLFTLILNALLIMLASRIVPGFSVSGFWAALLFSFILSIINSILSGIFR